MVLDIAQDGSSISEEKMFEGEFGRIRTAEIGPDGVLYLLTANGNNDKIIRISEVELEDATKFTSNVSSDDFPILYVLIGVVIVGIAAVAIVIKRKN